MRLATIRTASGTSAVRIDGDLAIECGARDVGELLATPEWRAKVREASEGIEAVKKELGTGRVYPETIIFSEGRSAPHIIAEGHTRATAQFLQMDAADEVEVLVGYAPLADWVFR